MRDAEELNPCKKFSSVAGEQCFRLRFRSEDHVDVCPGGQNERTFAGCAEKKHTRVCSNLTALDSQIHS